MGRKQARETAMQCLYQMDMHGEYTVDRIDAYIESIGQNDADKFCGSSCEEFYSAQRRS